MAVPKKKTSRSRRDKRRTHKRLNVPTYVTCPQCNEPKLPHKVCLNCGTYKGREIIPVED